MATKQVKLISNIQILIRYQNETSQQLIEVKLNIIYS